MHLGSIILAACFNVTAVYPVQIYADPNGPGLAGNLSKALYREYSDSTFTEQIPAPAQHGILGPILHARIGDTITVVFKVRL